MRIAASLNVKDEVELISLTIDNLRSIGVDLIIACDLGSTDGTLEILERHRCDESFWLYQMSDSETEPETWSRAQLALLTSSRADWAIFLDADEFWLPATGKLADCVQLPDSDVLVVDRFNIPLGPDGPRMPAKLSPAGYDEVLLFVEQSEKKLQQLMRENTETSWAQWATKPKIMARPNRIGGVQLGAHAIVPADTSPIRRAQASDLVIAHLPFSTRSRFQRKMENIRRLYRIHNVSPDETRAWHWWRWANGEDGIDREFGRNTFSSETIDALRKRGSVRSAAELFQERGCSPPIAAAIS